MRRLLTKVFVRLSRLFGIPELQDRLDHLNLDLDHLNLNVVTLRDEIGVSLTTIDNRTREQVSSAFASIDASAQLLARDIQDVLGHINEQSSHSENRVQSLNDALVSYVDEKDSQLRNKLETALNDLALTVTRVRESLDAVRRQSEVRDNSLQPSKSDNQEFVRETQSSISDAFYVSLENHFRGSRDLVAERQDNYLALLPNVITSENPVVDLGCGRGEWLSLLRKNEIPAFGIDSNVVCALECKENGLEVQQNDLLSFLRGRSDSSVGTYTLFQVLEHLPFNVLVDTFREIRRTLVPGGRLIAEIPNAKNLRVSAGTFWIDPTHQRPLYPDLIEFLAVETGFSKVEGLYVNDQSPELDLTGLPDGAQIAIRRILETVDTAQDYALIATA